MKEYEYSPATLAVLRDRLNSLRETRWVPHALAAEERKPWTRPRRPRELRSQMVYVWDALPDTISAIPTTNLGTERCFKVGRADRSVIRALPGADPKLRRRQRFRPAPRVDSPRNTHACDRERVFHRLLETTDHDRNSARTGGTEWLPPEFRFLDEVATPGATSREVADLAAPLIGHAVSWSDSSDESILISSDAEARQDISKRCAILRRELEPCESHRLRRFEVASSNSARRDHRVLSARSPRLSVKLIPRRSDRNAGAPRCRPSSVARIGGRTADSHRSRCSWTISCPDWWNC